MTTFVEKIEQSNDRPSDPRNREVVHPAADPQIGNLATPINSSKLTKTIINNLSAYRSGLSPTRRGLEVGLAHGYWLVGPFAKFNPLRYTDSGTLVAFLSASGLIVISTLAIMLYAASKPPKPLANITTPNLPREFSTQRGWDQYAFGFFGGGIAGAAVAYAILANVDVLGNFLHLVGAK
ncbi:MAG: photosystem I reaction centre subunit XI PsaL [Cyanobacteria bacterium RM1_2_2]|nr:photosystem I reaction centre subunit XI PsaL [Cyanobacteria bacterium RM1_2_2]